MLNEQTLNAVTGGWMIDLIGGLASLGARFGNWVGSVGMAHYTVSDSSGQHGHMDQFSASISPALLSTNGLGAREQHITVLNSNDMRDLGGARLTVGAVASLPPILQTAMGKEYGAKSDGLFAIAIPKNAVGASVSVPVVSQTGKGLVNGATLSVSKENAQFMNVRGVGMQCGVSMAGTVEFNSVKVDSKDPYAGDPMMMQQLRPDGTFKFPWEPW